MKKLLCYVFLIIAILVSFVSCNNDELSVVVDPDGYVVVNDINTGIIAEKPDVITEDADGYLVINGVKTEFNVHENVVGDSSNADPRPVTECCKDVISLMIELLNSDEYAALHSIPSTYNQILNDLRSGSYSKIDSIYEISFSEEDLLNQLMTEYNCSEELSKYMLSYVIKRSILNISAASGEGPVTVSSIFSAEKSFSNPNINKPIVYIFDFEDGLPIAITLIPDGEGIFRAHGTFIINNSFITDNENSIKESFKCIIPFEVTTINP